MRLSVLLSGLTMGAALALTAGAARAQHGESEYPVSFVERPLTLPRLTLAPQLELDIDRIGVAGTGAGAGGNLVVAGMQIGATFGITKDLEVGAIVLPIQFNNGAGYGGIFVGEEATTGNPGVFATFRFLHAEKLDLGARLRIQIATPHVGSGVGAFIEPSVPLLLHIGKIARFDAEVGIPIAVVGGGTAGGGHVAAGLDVPLKIAFDIIEPLHIGVSTGVRVDDFAHGGETTFIPLGIFAGYAIGEKKPIVDIDPFFSFYQFVSPGGGIAGDKINPGIFVAGVSARGYIYF